MANILTIPNEIKLAIVKYVSEQDALNMRFMSMEWAAAGVDGFFKNDGCFNFKPTRDQLTRLANLCANPEFVKNIRQINFNLGDFDSETLLEMWKTQRTLSNAPPSAKEYGQMRSLVRIPTYPGAWKQFAEVTRLTEIMSMLPNLKKVSVNRFGCPFPGKEADEHWAQQLRLYADRRVKWRVYDRASGITSLLGSYWQCASASLGFVEELNLGTVPVEALEELTRDIMQRQSNSASTTVATKAALYPNIKSLSIRAAAGTAVSPHEEDDQFVYSDKKLACNVVCLLSAFTNIRHLRLDLALEACNRVRTSFSIQFQRLHFPHLECAIIGNMQIPADEVRHFFYKHRSTLKKLVFLLVSTWLRQRWSRHILTEIRMNLNLDEFHHALCNCDFSLPMQTSTSRCTHRHPRAERFVELYVTKKIDWPFVDDEPQDSSGYHWNPTKWLVYCSYSDLYKKSLVELAARARGEWPPPSTPIMPPWMLD
ncbi:uncharacterized protein LY89DRAFT_716836 [Mollisia scopiformis]|uniref:F-box domain-containing protein n=1 Tax=Mollisia scopiformis TaxID=149040 RepID=A0A194XGL3_MOLSC|nr:uncharacterized protein LY89DRAFT_716836 [Mollisia scopiformis]KUJ19274.1 hypothetical protein LY89DRAFT_716836 [Mollisia scopiformis]